MLALGSLVATAGAAAAHAGGTWSYRAPALSAPTAEGVQWRGLGHDATGAFGATSPHSSESWSGPSGNENSGTSGGSGSGTSGDGVTGTSVGISPAPVEAPAAAVSGPAPDAAAAAPVALPNFAALVDVASAAPADDGTRSVVADPPASQLPSAPEPTPTPTPTPTPVAPSVPTPVPGIDVGALAGLPDLGSLGAVASGVPDGPAAARALLSTGTGRSVAMILALVFAILLFLSIHRRVDRSDRKLAAAGTGPDVARFR